MQRHGLRLSLCAMALGLSTSAFAQTDDETEEVEMSIKQPKRQRAVADDKYTMMTISGTIVDQVSNKPLAGIQLRMLGNERYTAMTGADGTFNIKVPTFATSLYVHAPGFMPQQVAVNAGDDKQKVDIKMLPDKYRAMYTDHTVYTAQSGFEASSNSITIENDIENTLGSGQSLALPLQALARLCSCAVSRLSMPMPSRSSSSMG